MWQRGDTVKWWGPCVCTGARHSHEGWHISRRTGTPCSTGSHDLSYHIDTSCAPSHGTAIRHTSNHVHYIRWLALKKKWQHGAWTSSSLHKQTITSTQPDIFTLTFWSLSETFISRSLFSSSSSLSHSHHCKALNSLICGDVPLRIYSLTHSSSSSCHTEMRRGKKSVACVAQRVAALIPVQGSSSLFPNMYYLCDPSSTFVRFSVPNCNLHAEPHVPLISCHVASLTCQNRKNW